MRKRDSGLTALPPKIPQRYDIILQRIAKQAVDRTQSRLPIVFVASGCSKCRCLGLCDSCCCSCSWSCSHSCSCSSSRSSSHFSERHIPIGLLRTRVHIIAVAITLTISASELELCPLQRQLAFSSHFQEQAAASAGSLLWQLSEGARNTYTGDPEESTIEETERQADVNISYSFDIFETGDTFDRS